MSLGKPALAFVGTTAVPRSINVFVAEDHCITRWGLQQLIDGARPRMGVVGSAATRAELMTHDAAAQADIILLDLDLAGEDATESMAVLRQRCPGRVLVLTGVSDPAAHRQAVLRGARGVVHKSEPAETLLRAIEKVDAGEVWLNRSLLGDVLGQLTGAEPTAAACADDDARRIASLTPRERGIVRAMVQHYGAKQFAIADTLGMSEHTLRNHLTSIYGKLGLHGRLDLHVWATSHGLGAAPREDA